jgi:hypothetical protein
MSPDVEKDRIPEERVKIDPGDSPVFSFFADSVTFAALFNFQ